MNLTPSTARRAALALAVVTPLFLFWAIGAVGVIGAEGDSADLMYLAVFGVVVGGAAASRLEAPGMTRTMVAAAVAQGLVAVVALLRGEHEVPVTSVLEILGVNAMFVVLFATAALLFAFSARQQSPEGLAVS